MTLTQLRYLIAIVDAGLNITLAAARVHATQPGLSKQLRQLEDELGFQLFVRRGKSLGAVTDAGRQVLERARVMLAEASSIRAIAANLRNDGCGDLRIATTHTQARFALPASLAALNRRFPQVSVHLRPGRDMDVLAQLESGRADLAVMSTVGAPPAMGIALPAYRWQRVIAVPRNHPLSTRNRPPTLADLAGQPLISYDSSQKPESSLQGAFAAAGLHPHIAMTAGDADLIKTYVRAGLGVGVLAEMAMLPADAADLRVLPANHLFPQCTTWVVLRREGVVRDYVLEFIGQFAPHLDRRDVVRALASAPPAEWPTAPSWHARPLQALPDAA